MENHFVLDFYFKVAVCNHEAPLKFLNFRKTKFNLTAARGNTTPFKTYLNSAQVLICVEFLITTF